tara:strand:+ start:8772 stop:8993 length:222 start_codon:yes stop_codon:yes gene_type:complete
MKESEIKELIAEVLKVSIDVIDNELAIGDIPEWDSLAHMQIIAAIESNFDIVLDIEQVLDIEDVQDILDSVLS